MQRIFVISGPESTGKSTLTEQLASEFSGALVPEFAREYLIEKGTNYSEEDLFEIAKGQQALIDSNSSELLFCDTDVLTVVIWLATRFGSTHEKMFRMWQNFKPDLYLLCKPDVPWIYDPLRECEHIREDLFMLQKDLLFKEQKPFEVIEGDYQSRFEQAKAIIQQML